MRINGIENSNINLFTGNNAAKDIQSQKNQASKNNPDSL